MKTMSTTQAALTIGATVDHTRFEPVELTRYGRPVAILLDTVAWNELLIHLSDSAPSWLKKLDQRSQRGGT